jgi:hypothetical protein
MSYEESAAFFNLLDNLEKIKKNTVDSSVYPKFTGFGVTIVKRIITIQQILGQLPK